MTLRLGKKPATYDARDFKYTDLRPKTLALPKLPTTWSSAGDFSNWGMLGNGPCDDGSITDTSSYAYNGAGNCFWAGSDHETMQAEVQAGTTPSKFTCLASLNEYALYLGLSDASQINANNDEGTDVRDGLKRRQNPGIVDASGNSHTIGAYISLELGNWQHLREASYLFESVGLGINFPESAMDQFNKGQPWSVVPGAQIEGGHYIPIVGHPGNGFWTVITWGKAVNATWQFVGKYGDELWAYVTLERYNAVTGETAEGFKDVDLEKYISAVGTGAENS